MQKNSYTGWGQVLDFAITVSLIAFLLLAVWLGGKLLYPEATAEKYTVIETERMPICHSGSIACGEAVYDTVTKRRIGTVTDIREYIDGDRMYYRLTVRTSASPRSNALRTRDVWFYFKEAAEEILNVSAKKERL
ncbi:MAG: hypothetical protein IKD45_01895 [Clostridia bacterium]|nr:hypothetical protein [Clostridia bacterium]